MKRVVPSEVGDGATLATIGALTLWIAACLHALFWFAFRSLVTAFCARLLMPPVASDSAMDVDKKKPNKRMPW